MSRRLLIVGAGGFGREILNWAMDVENAGADWTIGGFLDADPEASCDLPIGVIGDPATYSPTEDDRFVCAIGDPATKLQVCRSLESRGAQFITLIHPTAIVGRGCQVGNGSILCPYAVLTADVTVGRFVTLNVAATVGHNAVVGDGCTLSGHCDSTGYTRLGEGVMMGSHAVVLPGMHVGDFAVVGAGSVVVRSIEAVTTVFGIPARKIGPSRGSENQSASPRAA